MEKIRKAYVHIGMPKTGTTAIQDAMACSRSCLRSVGLIYPGDENDHVLLVPAFHQFGSEHYYFKSKMETPESLNQRVVNFLNEIADIAKTTDGELLFSSEYLYNLNTEAFERMDHFFADQGFEMIVVCCLRHPVDAATSETQQNVKQGAARLADMFASPSWLSSKNTLQSAIGAIGRDRIVAFDYTSAKDIGVERFLLNLIGYGHAASLINSTRSNESLSMAAVYLCDAHNEISVHYPEITHKRGYVFSIGGEKFRLPEAVEGIIRSKSSEEVAWLEENFGISVKEQIKSNSNKNDVFSRSAARDIVKIILQLNQEDFKI